MPYVDIDGLEKVTRNKYEAVIVASQHARYLNQVRLAKFQQIDEGMLEVDIEARKMTAVALRDLLEGRVKFERVVTE